MAEEEKKKIEMLEALGSVSITCTADTQLDSYIYWDI